MHLQLRSGQSFLFRHYLELVLKSIAVNLGRLETKEKNLPKERWREWPSNEHKLAVHWEGVKTEFPKKMGQDWWESLDTEFISKCVKEFHDIDPSSQRLRYLRERNIILDELEQLGVSWSALLRTIDHSWDVLDNMDGDAEFVYNRNKKGPPRRGILISSVNGQTLHLAAGTMSSGGGIRIGEFAPR